MLLAIDVGNTQTVLGLFKDPYSTEEDLMYHWRVTTRAEITADELALLIKSLLELSGLSYEIIEGISFSTSVPEITEQIKVAAQKWLRVPLVVVEPGIKTGISILYDNPKEVGADRITNAVGAYQSFKGPTIVVDMGTATTFDVISQAGEYLGGAIVPGVEISLESLFNHAAGLRRINLAEPKRLIGKSTVESLQSGAIYGFAKLVDGMCELFEGELGKCTKVATGGIATLFSPYCKNIDYLRPWITLYGLKIIFNKNR